MRKAAKEETVVKLQEKFLRAKSALLTDYRGLSVAEITELRNQLRKASVEYQVVKNTLAKIATRDTPLQALDPYFSGPTAVAWSYGDPLISAKVLSSFAKARPTFGIKAAYLEGKVFGKEEVLTIAELPPRQELLSCLVGRMQAPLQGMVAVLHGALRSLVATLEAIRVQREKQ
ncbi:MAG: 50S ribosomal protein L10 [candidate division NC10 bacterium]|nr:50S ribosomal protein L10 [candidate division NC10 bacterium]